jgi:ABC-2 type transport system ATP-binding protein
MAVTIGADGLVKRYGEQRALDGFDLEVNRGTVFGLLGPNGAGKTTAVRSFAPCCATTQGAPASPVATPRRSRTRSGGGSG